MAGLLASNFSSGSSIVGFNSGNIVVKLNPSGKSLTVIGDYSGNNIPAGKTLCRTLDSSWKGVDNESDDNGTLFTVWGTFAVFNPEGGPGSGVVYFLYVPEIVNA